MKNSEEIQCYTQDEIKELLDKKERLVFVKTRDEEVIARYEDIPDVITDFFNKFVYTNMEFYDYETAEEILTTFGPFLHKCKPEVREDIIGRLEKLQKHEIEVKDYKIVHEEDMATYINSLEGVIEMKESIKNEKQQYDEELDLLYRKGLIEIDELDDMQRQKRIAQEK